MSFSEDLDQERRRVVGAVRDAGLAWAEAMRAHKLAPPDVDFAHRLRTLSVAAEREQIAWEEAGALGIAWRPVPGAEQAEPPYELRRGSGRRGPERLWGTFDRSVAALNLAIAGSEALAVANAFGDLSVAAGVLADAVAREDAAPIAGQAPPASESDAFRTRRSVA